MCRSRSQRFFKKQSERPPPTSPGGVHQLLTLPSPSQLPWLIHGLSTFVAAGGSAKSPLSPAYSGPYAVTSSFPKYFILDMGDRQESISVDRLKPHLGSAIFTPAVAPRKGRPLKLVAPPGTPHGGGVVSTPSASS